MGLHRCKTGFEWCKRLLGDFCSLSSNYLLHPLLTICGNFPFLGSLPELSDCKPRPIDIPLVVEVSSEILQRALLAQLVRRRRRRR